jgi:hypothetical protein
MRPPMRNQANISIEDRTQPPDRYGKYPVKDVTTKARVKHSTEVIRREDGTTVEARLEVDLPPEINLQNGQSIKAQDNFGVWHTATIESISEATNFAGNRVFYRTCYCA